MKYRILLLSSFALLAFPAAFPRRLYAQSCTTTAANANLSTVQAAVNAASSGARICVPAGNAVWNGTLQFPTTTKDLALVGAGIGLTNINCGTNACVAMSNTSTQELTGFTFTWTVTGQATTLEVRGPVTPGKFHLVHHNSFQAPSAGWMIFNVQGGGPAGKHPTGLWHNNIFNKIALHISGTDNSLSDSSAQHQIWSQSSPLGDFVDVVYVEDNQFTGDSVPGSGFQNFNDGNYGGRQVWRFNTHSGHGTGNEIHSVQGLNRAKMRWEIYGNSYAKNSASFYPPIFARGGYGIIFDNVSSTDYSDDILTDNVRSCRDPGEGNGKCDGSSNWDQNSPGQQGYACRDQIGRANDATPWSPGLPYSQQSSPVYSFNNIKGASAQWQWVISTNDSCGGSTPADLSPSHIRENRDFYNLDPNFNGTTGVGRGPIASRPTTCTQGVAYWATDEGEWNSRHPGPDGRLYKCTAPNTWTLFYTPYPYPHPLQSAIVGGPPAPPTNLRTVP